MVSKQIKFRWTPIATECPDIHYVINASNCGNCPTTTNHTTVTCTDVPSDGNICTFALKTQVCSDVFGKMSEPVFVVLGDNTAAKSSQADCTIAIVSAGLLAGILAVSTVTFSIALALVRFVRGRRPKNEPDNQLANYEDISNQVPSTVAINTRKNVAYGQVHISNASTS